MDLSMSPLQRVTDILETGGWDIKEIHQKCWAFAIFNNTDGSQSLLYIHPK
jgi:hypothetical protein